MRLEHTMRGIGYLAFGRIGIIAVGITGADFAVHTVNHNVGMVLDGLLSCQQTSLFLRLGNVGGAGVSFCDGLPVSVRTLGYVNILSHTLSLLIPSADPSDHHAYKDLDWSARTFPDLH